MAETTEFLLSLINIKLSTRRRIKMLDKIETINGYDLLFILSAIIRNRFSGHLIVVNEENELSGITFIYGDIVKVDYPDQENLLGNLIIQEEMISKIELDKILSRAPRTKIGQHLVENNYISNEQLRYFISKQSKLRLAKYVDNSKVRINFNFDGESDELAVINYSAYFEILHTLIFQNYKPEWLEHYEKFYSDKFFSLNSSEEVWKHFEKFDLALQIFKSLKDSKNKRMTYFDLREIINLEALQSIKLFHFMILAGLLIVRSSAVSMRNKNARRNIKTGPLPTDLQRAKELILQHKYFEAFSRINKYSSLMSSNMQVNFYFVWIKIHGNFYSGYVLDLNKITIELDEIDPHMVGLGNYNYVKALLEAGKNNTKKSIMYFEKAVKYDKMLAKYPIFKNNSSSKLTSFVKGIKKAVGL